MKKLINRHAGNEQMLMIVLAIILCLTALWAISCGGGGSYSSTPTAPSASTTAPTPAATTPAQSTTPSVAVNIVSSSGSGAFNPNPVQAASGANIVWKNDTSATHVLVMNDGTMIGTLAPGASLTTALSGSGGSYHCTIHPSMVGSINGATAPAPPTGTGSDY